jgi:hypothetical protein
LSRTTTLIHLMFQKYFKNVKYKIFLFKSSYEHFKKSLCRQSQKPLTPPPPPLPWKVITGVDL